MEFRLSSESDYMILATLLVRDEEDILGANIKHHISEGIEMFIATDNGSLDKSREILTSFPQVKVVIDEPEHNHNQTKWVTRMARLACDFCPDWIIHLDCDEFWIGLKNLEKETHNYLNIPVYKHLSCDLNKYVLDESMWKIAHRPSSEVLISNGNHFAYNIGEAKMSDNIFIHHFPIRNYSQFEKKVIKGSALLQQPRRMIMNTGIHWQRWYEIYLAGELRKEYDRIVEEDSKLSSLGSWFFR